MSISKAILGKNESPLRRKCPVIWAQRPALAVHASKEWPYSRYRKRREEDDSWLDGDPRLVTNRRSELSWPCSAQPCYRSVPAPGYPSDSETHCEMHPEIPSISPGL